MGDTTNSNNLRITCPDTHALVISGDEAIQCKNGANVLLFTCLPIRINKNEWVYCLLLT